MSTKPYTFDRVVRLLIGLAILILLFLLIKKLSNVLLPFVIAWFIAYLLQPIVRFFQYKLKLKNRILSITSTLLIFFIAIIGIISFLSPMISREFEKLTQILILYSKGISVNTFLPIAWQNEIKNYITHLDIMSILQDQNFISAIKNLTPHLSDFIYGSLDFIIGLSVVFIVFVYLIFILLDYEKITSSWLDILPPVYRVLVSGIIKDVESGMNRYFRGQALVALIVAILFITGFSLIQLPLAIVLGLLMGVFTMVPYLRIILIVPALGLGFLQSAETGVSFGSVLLGIAIVFIVIQVLEEFILIPKIMGKVTGLNPAAILLSLSVWGSLMGMLGLIIALPMTTLIISYYKRFFLKEVILPIEAPETHDDLPTLTQEKD